MPSIHQAAAEGNRELLKKVISSGANPTEIDEEGESALHYGAAGGHHDCVRLLLKVGCDPLVKDKHGMTPLHEAVLNQSLDCVKVLVEEGNMDVNCQDDEGWTPFHLAVLFENIEICKYLISKGADLNATTKQQETPLHLVAMKGAEDFVRSLISRGANIQTEDLHGNPALHLLPLQKIEHIDIPSSSSRLKELASNLAPLINVSEYSDICFDLGEDTVIYGHKCIIFSRCKYLKKLYSEQEQVEKQEGIERVRIEGISKAIFLGILEWLYAGTVRKLLDRETSVEYAFQMLATSERFELPSLTTFTQAAIVVYHKVSKIDFSSDSLVANTIFQYALDPPSTSSSSSTTAIFCDFCSQKILKNAKEYKDLPQFQKLSNNDIFQILKKVKIEQLAEDEIPEHLRKKANSSIRQKSSEGPRKLEGKNLRLCKRFISSLMKDPDAYPFNEPVDPVKLNIPDYFDIIKNPMDFGTIKKKLETGAYKGVDDFISDVQLVFDNAVLYNGDKSAIARMAEKLRESFKKKLDGASFEKGKYGAAQVTISKKRKSSSTEQRQSKKMTLAEKKSLGSKLNRLNTAQLLSAIDIINESKKFVPESDTLEIDIAKVDENTLQKLDKYISQCLSQNPSREENVVIEHR